MCSKTSQVWYCCSMPIMCRQGSARWRKVTRRAALASLQFCLHMAASVIYNETQEPRTQEVARVIQSAAARLGTGGKGSFASWAQSVADRAHNEALQAACRQQRQHSNDVPLFLLAVFALVALVTMFAVFLISTIAALAVRAACPQQHSSRSRPSNLACL